VGFFCAFTIYWMWLSMIWRIMQTEEAVIHWSRTWLFSKTYPNCLQGLHNSSYYVKAEFNNWFIIHYSNKKYWKWKFIQCNFSHEFFVLVIDFPVHVLFLSLSQLPIIFHIGLKLMLVIGQLSKYGKKLGGYGDLVDQFWPIKNMEIFWMNNN